MPTLRRLLQAGMAAVIMYAAVTGQGFETTALSSDNMGDDIKEISVAEVKTPSAKKKVKEITPDFSAQIREKFAVNDDTVGWLHVPGTDINDVILKNPFHKSNAYYLELDINKRPDKNGMYCADFRTVYGSGKRRELSRITTLYGHSWNDDPDSMLFAQLKRYRNPEFAKSHPYIFFSTEAENMAWEVFAVFDTTINLPYITPNLPDENLPDLLSLIERLSYYNSDIVVSEQDKLLTLSTCTYSVMGHDSLPDINNYRFAIMARLVKPGDELKTEANFTVNTDRLAPDGIRAIMDELNLPSP